MYIVKNICIMFNDNVVNVLVYLFPLKESSCISSELYEKVSNLYLLDLGPAVSRKFKVGFDVLKIKFLLRS